MTLYQGVILFKLLENGETRKHFQEPLCLRTEYDPQGVTISFLPARDTSGSLRLLETLLERGNPLVRCGRCGFIISIESACYMFKFINEQDATSFQVNTSKALKGNDASVFAERTEDSSALQYFQFYGYLSQQQNMMQDYIRTATYQKAIHANFPDFQDKVILDVGAGSGILSFFAIQAGAKKVYAVEASSMAQHAEALACHNGLKGKLIVVAGKIEEVELPEKVDAIVSEPMGYMLYNERMLETYLHAKKWLKSGGKMFPTLGDLHVAPFSDEALYLEQCNKANFWQQSLFHGIDLSCLKGAAMKEYFRQPIVDTFDIRICLAKSVKNTVNFLEASEYDLHEIVVPFEFEMLETGTVHGLAFWFDVAFEGTASTVWLSTAPTEALTHWYQVRCLVETPRVMLKGQILKGKTVLSANKKQSYDVYIEFNVDGMVITNTLDLKNPYFRYTGQAPQPPPGHHTTAPSESIWATTTGGGDGTVIANGGSATHLASKGMTVVDALGNVVEVPAAAHPVMSVLPSGNVATHQFQQATSLTHYTAVPLLGEYSAAAGGQHQGLLLNNTNVSVLPATATSHGVHWSH